MHEGACLYELLLHLLLVVRGHSCKEIDVILAVKLHQFHWVCHARPLHTRSQINHQTDSLTDIHVHCMLMKLERLCARQGRQTCCQAGEWLLKVEWRVGVHRLPSAYAGHRRAQGGASCTDGAASLDDWRHNTSHHIRLLTTICTVRAPILTKFWQRNKCPLRFSDRGMQLGPR